jgi:hypothetical protein
VGIVGEAVVETVLVAAHSMEMPAVAAEESQPLFLQRWMVARPVAPIVAVPIGSVVPTVAVRMVPAALRQDLMVARSAVPTVAVQTVPVAALHQDLKASRSAVPIGTVVYTLAAVAAMEAVDSCCFLP